MTFSMIVNPMLEERERVRRERGEAAAQELAHSQVGSALGMGRGAITGATIGSVVPGVGTAIGGIVGAFVGGLIGSNDKTAADNGKSARKYGRSVLGLRNHSG